MAVLDEVPGIEVTIQVGGESVTEYVDPYALDLDLDVDYECPVVTKYIESIDDTEFSVKVAIDDDAYAWDDIEHYLHANVVIDGSQAIGFVVKMGDKELVFRGKPSYSEEFQHWCYRTWKFSAISTVEDFNKARIEKDIETIKNIGLIEISLERGVREKLSKAPSSNPLIDNNTHEVAEKALKGKSLSHSVSFGKTQIIEHPNMWSSCKAGVDNGPIAIFRFIYRSQESLKQELIIPRSLSPEPGSIGHMTRAEIWRLAQERFDQINSAEEAKSRDRSAMKRRVNEVVDVDEEAEKARKAKRLAVTIDLTED